MKTLIDMVRRTVPIAGLSAALIGGGALAQPASAPAAAKTSQSPCFFITQWNGWKSPSPDVIYLGVNMHDVYRADLSSGSSQLGWPDVHLVSEVRGSDSICNALDLQLSVADTHGFRQPLIVRTLRKLTPDEVAAIPKKFRPN